VTTGDTEPGPLVPDWLIQATGLGWRLLVIAAFGVVVLAAAAVLSIVVGSVILGVAATAAFDPLAERLRRQGRSPVTTAGIVTLAVGGLAVVVIALVAVAFVPATLSLLHALNTGLTDLQQALESGDIPAPAATLIGDTTTAITSWLSSTASSVAASLATVFTVILLAFFLVFFLVTDLDRAVGWTLQAAAPWQRATIKDGVVTARARLGRSLRQTALSATVLGIVALLISLVLNLPAPLALAVVVFAGGFIPLLGPVAAIAGLGLVALGSAGGAAAIVAVGFLAATAAFLPRILGPGRWTGNGLHPALILVALAVGALVGGMLGLILAVPVVIVVIALGPAVVASLNGSPALEPSQGIVPRWLDRLAQWSWRLLVVFAAIALGLFLLGQIPLIVIPLVLAAVAAATMAPGMAILTRKGLSSTTASLVMTVGGFGAIVIILVLTLASMAGPVDQIVGNAGIGAGKLDGWANSGQSLASIVAAIAPTIAQAAATILKGLAALGIAIVLGAILTFFLLRDGRLGLEAVTSPLVKWRRDEVEAAAGRATGVLGAYMLGTGVISAFGGLTQALIMVILGLPLAGPLGVLAFFGGFIPYFGPFVATMLGFLVAVAVGTPQDVLIMFIFTIVFNIVQGNIVAPLVYSRAVSIHPALVLLAIPAGGAIAGVAGMFLAVPLLGVLATTWRTVLDVFGSQPSGRATSGTTETESTGYDSAIQPNVAT
jgi:putative heme transporter